MKSSPWWKLYNERTQDYEQFVQREDLEGNLLPALNEIHGLENANVVEFGAGTGRITAQIAPVVQNVWAFDITPAMVRVANEKRIRSDQTNWLAGVGDSRAMPVGASCADIAIEGWSLFQIAAWHMDTWQKDVGRAISEMFRVVRPGGSIILVETFGTGVTEPDPPARYVPIYEHWERKWGFSSTWIRTDIRFTSADKARAMMMSTFGGFPDDAMIASDESIIIPECTGIWWRRKELDGVA